MANPELDYFFSWGKNLKFFNMSSLLNHIKSSKIQCKKWFWKEGGEMSPLPSPASATDYISI